jgi:hypothetical protein
MPIPTTPGFDATHANLPQVPNSAGQAAGYISGSPDIAWTLADFKRFPKAIRIDQAAFAAEIDKTADIFDYENGAVNDSILATVIKGAQVNYRSRTMPGQRNPGVYCSRGNVTHVVNTLIAGGISACPLWVADWNNNSGQAAAEIAYSGGPFPIIGRQYSDQGGGGTYDLDVFSQAWLDTVSGGKDPAPTSVTPQSPPGQWNNPNAWSWKGVSITGLGLDGQVYVFIYDLTSGNWGDPIKVT